MSLTVLYGPRRFKVPVTPGTLLGQVRDEVCNGEGGLNLRSSDYGLKHQGKSLDLTLPFRLANLVNNAQVELVRAKQVEDIRVKVRIPQSPDFIGQFPRSTTIEGVLATAGLQGQLLLNNVAVKPETELASLGGAGGVLFVFVAASKAGNGARAPGQAPGSAASHAAQTPRSPQTTSQASSQPSQASQPSSKSSSQPPSAAPARNAVLSQASRADMHAEEPPEMDTRQFATYYQHLKQQAEPPMVSKSTQAKLKDKKPVEATTVRIRFPDQNLLEGKFANGEVGSDVYDFVKMYLRDPAQKFELVSMKPQFVLQPAAHLVDELGSRALLVFRPPSGAKPPFLNDKALALARPPASQSASQPANQSSHKAPEPKAAEEKPKEAPKEKSKFKKPKWLKLHK